MTVQAACLEGTSWRQAKEKQGSMSYSDSSCQFKYHHLLKYIPPRGLQFTRNLAPFLSIQVSKITDGIVPHIYPSQSILLIMPFDYADSLVAETYVNIELGSHICNYSLGSNICFILKLNCKNLITGPGHENVIQSEKANRTMKVLLLTNDSSEFCIRTSTITIAISLLKMLVDFISNNPSQYKPMASVSLLIIFTNFKD